MTTSTVSSFGERALIARVTARLASRAALPPWVLVGPGDDAAVIAPERGTHDVVTTDAIVEGVHFDRRFVPADAIGHRALAVNLSDLAAMGARPRAALLSLMLPDALDTAVLDGITDGLAALAARHQVSVVGGNITRTSGPMVIDVTAIGSVRPRRVLTRAGARPGDEVYVTGSLGAAAFALDWLRDGRDPALEAATHRYLRPEPRIRAGVLLGRNRAASSCMDLSDGLGDAVRQIAETSGVGMTIDAAALPIDETVRAVAGEAQARHLAIGGGDDYELLFTSHPSQRGALRGVRRTIGDLRITKIGVVTKARAVLLKEEQGTRELPGGYEHFR